MSKKTPGMSKNIQVSSRRRLGYLGGAIYAVSLAASVLAFSVQAGEIEYTYLELGYETGSYDRVDIDYDLDTLVVRGFFPGNDFDGAFLRGSFAVTDNIHVFGNYYANGANDSSTDLAFPLLEVGAGYNYSLATSTDLVVQLAWLRQDFELENIILNDQVDDLTFKDAGFGLNVGVRSLLTPKLEVNGFIKHRDLWSEENTSLDGQTTNLTLGAAYRFLPNFSMTGELEFGEVMPDVDYEAAFRIGARINF